MSWAELQENWARSVDLIILRFPNTDRATLLDIGGDLAAFAHYLAHAHDLTFKEAMDAVDFALLKDMTMTDRKAKAA